MDFEPTNLDDRNIEELKSLSRVFYAYSQYATRKADSMELRLRGKIQWALDDEKELDNIYKGLPDQARW